MHGGVPYCILDGTLVGASTATKPMRRMKAVKDSSIPRTSKNQPKAVPARRFATVNLGGFHRVDHG